MSRKEHASGIGTMQEKSLHAALKKWYAQPGDRFEQRVSGYIIDIQREELLIEIQLASFSALKRKLNALTQSHTVRLVHPIAEEKWIVRESPAGTRTLGRRRSPKKGEVLHLFKELVSIPELAAHPNFSLEILQIREEEHRRRTGARCWRRNGWSIHDRRLLEVTRRETFTCPDDYRRHLPASLPDQFTNKELAEALGQPRWLAEKMTYCLRKMGALAIIGKRGAANLMITP